MTLTVLVYIIVALLLAAVWAMAALALVLLMPLWPERTGPVTWAEKAGAIVVFPYVLLLRDREFFKAWFGFVFKGDRYYGE